MAHSFISLKGDKITTGFTTFSLYISNSHVIFQPWIFRHDFFRMFFPSCVLYVGNIYVFYFIMFKILHGSLNPWKSTSCSFINDPVLVIFDNLTFWLSRRKYAELLFIYITSNTLQHFAFGCIKLLFVIHFHYANNPEATTTGI